MNSVRRTVKKAKNRPGFFDNGQISMLHLIQNGGQVKTIGKSFIGFITLIGFCFLVLIIYVSLLGENSKIDSVVENFFKNIQDQRYFSTVDNQSIVESFNVFDIEGEYSENCLLLELALFEKYDIPDAYDYEIEIEKSHFWIPFLNDSNIDINVSLEKPDNSKIFPLSNKSEFVDDLFTVARKSGRWRITSINIRDSSLIESVNKLRDSINIDSYISFSGTKLTIKPIEIDTENITIIEKRKLNYIFQKLHQIAETSGNITGES